MASRTVPLSGSARSVPPWWSATTRSGKSSLVEAFALVFDLPDDSKSTRIRDIQPVGQDVAPEVTVELTPGRSRADLHQALAEEPLHRTDHRRARRPAAVLDRARGAQRGRAAVRTSTSIPCSGRRLMVGQGQSLVLPTPADAEPLITAVTAESGTPVDGASMPLVTAVEHEYLRYWTPGRSSRPATSPSRRKAVVGGRAGRRAGVEGDGGGGQPTSVAPSGWPSTSRIWRAGWTEHLTRRRGTARAQAGDRRDPAPPGLGRSPRGNRPGAAGEPHPYAGRAGAAARRGRAVHQGRRRARRASASRRRDRSRKSRGGDRAGGRGRARGGRRAQGRAAYRRTGRGAARLRR